MDLPFEHVDLPVVDLHQVADRLDTDGVGPPKGHLVEQDLAAGSEHVAQSGQDPLLGHHRVSLGLQTGAHVHELGPVADQLA